MTVNAAQMANTVHQEAFVVQQDVHLLEVIAVLMVMGAPLLPIAAIRGVSHQEYGNNTAHKEAS